MKDRIEKSQCEVKTRVDSKGGATSSDFCEGDVVRIRKPRMGDKLKPVYSEPMAVQKIGQDTYRLENGSKWNASRLIPESNRENVCGEDLREGNLEYEPHSGNHGEQPLEEGRPCKKNKKKTSPFGILIMTLTDLVIEGEVALYISMVCGWGMREVRWGLQLGS
jgi:hypothetical protein